MMKIHSLFFIFALLCGTLNASPQQTVAEGVTYEVRKTDTPLTIHILRVDPTKVIIRPMHALNTSFGLETTSDMAKRAGAIAAINGSFFKTAGKLRGKPAGILKIDHEWYSLPNKPRGAAAWNEASPKLTVDRIVAKASAQIGQTAVQIDELNAARGDAQAVLFTPIFHRTTLTNPGGKELISCNNQLVAIKQEINDSKIPLKGFVLSLGSRHPLINQLFTVGQPCSYEITSIPLLDSRDASRKIWNDAQHIVGGTPVLIKEGTGITTFKEEMVIETFLTHRHPRTAIGSLADGSWVFVVVDGRSTLSSSGMTMEELQNLMLELGCVQALNLDGGGSSTMTIEDVVVNTPSGGYDDTHDINEIEISDAILVLRKV